MNVETDLSLWIEDWKGDWNIPHLEIKSLHHRSNGKGPICRGGCFGVIYQNKKFIILGEDDDHYWEEIILNTDDFLDLAWIYQNVDKSIKIDTDYVKAKSKQTYLSSKKDFLNTDFNKGKFKVSFTDRGQSPAPLIHIASEDLKYESRFDVSHCKERYETCIKALNILTSNTIIK